MDDDFTGLFDDLDGPTESERPARKSRLDEIEIDDSEGLRAIVEAECAEIIECYDGDHVLTDVDEVPVYGIKTGDRVESKPGHSPFGTPTVKRVQQFTHGHRLTVEHDSGDIFYTTSVEAFQVVR